MSHGDGGHLPWTTRSIYSSFRSEASPCQLPIRSPARPIPTTSALVERVKSNLEAGLRQVALPTTCRECTKKQGKKTTPSEGCKKVDTRKMNRTQESLQIPSNASIECKERNGFLFVRVVPRRRKRESRHALHRKSSFRKALEIANSLPCHAVPSMLLVPGRICGCGCGVLGVVWCGVVSAVGWEIVDALVAW